MTLPLITASYLAYAAGLLAGFSGRAWVAVLGAMAVSALFLFRRALHHTGLSLLFCAGVIVAASSPAPVIHPTTRASRSVQAGPLARFRLRAANAIDLTFGDDAPLARALLIADQRQIPTEIRDRYAAAGIIHMLSISGLHVAVIAAAIELLFQVVRMSRRAALLGSFVATALYVAVIGAPAPALRSAGMLGVSMTSRVMQRPTSPWAAWAIGAFIPLVAPRTVLDVGYQLSVLGMCALVAAGALWRRHLSRHLSGWKGKLYRELVTSLVACAITAPLVAWVFGRVSLIAPLSNLVAAPIIGLAQPLLFLTLLLAPLGVLAHFCAQAVHPLLFAFDWVALTASTLPFAWIVVATSPATALLAAGAGLGLVMACMSRFPIRPALAALACISLITIVPALPVRGNGQLELHILDVGQGDAILLRTPRGRWVLFDAGPAWNAGDAGRSTILPYILHRGGTLDAFVLSHPHTDHVGGAASVITALRPRYYWDAAFAGGSQAYIASLKAARTYQVEWRRVHPGDSLAIDGATISFLAPDSAWTVGLKDPNLASTVASVHFGMVRFLLVGDAEWAEETWLLAHHAGELRADVLKVGHHGSSTSSSDAFLAAVHPAVAVISVGAGNKYGHPSNDVIRALDQAGAAVFRTDEAGTIIVRTDGRQVELEEHGEKWAPFRASSTQ
ncbi:MAG: DNA internalization-related competence protein ComEC/Rec2 [Gemmatimonadaceae bacterium]